MLKLRALIATTARGSFTRVNGSIVDWFGLLSVLFPGILSQEDGDTSAVTALIRMFFAPFFWI